MNRLLITEAGDQIRNELKREIETQNRQPSKKSFRLPDIPQTKNLQVSFFFQDSTDRFGGLNENPLYKKTLSEIALSNLTRAASLSMLGSQGQQQLENQIRENLQLPNNYKYLNQNLEKFVKNIVEDKALKTKRKRQLLHELQKLKCKTQDQEVSQFSNCVEETDLSRKLMEIVNAEGKLEQLHRRYLQKEQQDRKLKIALALSVERLYEKRSLHIDAINPHSAQVLHQTSQEHFKRMMNDKSEVRYHDRLKEKQTKKVMPIWNMHHIPNTTNRWQSWIEQAKARRCKTNQQSKQE